MAELHGGDRDRLLVHPNVWAGIGLVRGGVGTALVGSLRRGRRPHRSSTTALGFDEFILSGYPHLEEAYWFGEGVMPRAARGGASSPPLEAPDGAGLLVPVASTCRASGCSWSATSTRTSTHIAGDYPELFAALLGGHDVELVRYDLDRGPLPRLRSRVRRLALLAEPLLGRTTTLAWIAPTPRTCCASCSRPNGRTWASASGTSSLAQALGAPVARAADGWQVGVHDYEIVRATGRGCDPPRGTRHAHREPPGPGARRVPDGAELLARGVRRVPGRRLHRRRAGVDAPTASRVRARRSPTTCSRAGSS